MTFEELNRTLPALGGEIFMVRQTNPHDPRLLPDTKRAILTEGPWHVKIVSLRNKLGNSDNRSAEGIGHKPEEAFGRALHAWLNPVVFTPKPKPQALELDLDLGDLEL